MSTTQQESCHLLRLPPELRKCIYQLVATLSEVHFRKNKLLPGQTALLRTVHRHAVEQAENFIADISDFGLLQKYLEALPPFDDDDNGRRTIHVSIHVKDTKVESYDHIDSWLTASVSGASLSQLKRVCRLIVTPTRAYSDPAEDERFLIDLNTAMMLSNGVNQEYVEEWLSLTKDFELRGNDKQTGSVADRLLRQW
ncbi:hypothetical protein LTR78_006718 [Recurvomyces mirabilis]|uniref:Uncharacterized protein n=1 Tax=Recurvomyces mirabilis TaxID=574656 RepID=A0AAE0WKN9_9PEZI|nr:hypothetical protein LTR78_006718 [Recurvomyces mirabilis]KAK5151393.1 hypothetical protein LTS14_009236 [Recurvomyces mirabilis]